MNAIDNYRQSEFSRQAAQDRRYAKDRIVLAVIAAAFIAVDLWLLLRLLAAY